MTISRRNFLIRIVGWVGTSTLAGLGFGSAHWLLGPKRSDYPYVGQNNPGQNTTPTRQTKRLIRPPGAKTESEFLAACIRCTRCQEACDVGAIQLLDGSFGKHYHSPLVDPTIKACNLCMKCTQICPTGALQPIAQEQRSKVSMGSVELVESRCLSHKARMIRDQQAQLARLGGDPTQVAVENERRGPCGECYTFCPLRGKAITLEPGGFLAPVVHPEACVGCGLCEEICRAILADKPAIEVVAIRRWS